MDNKTKLIRVERGLADWLKAEAKANRRPQGSELAMILEAEQARRQQTAACNCLKAEGGKGI